MRNLKHTIAALAAVSLVGSLAVHQAMNLSAVKATKLTVKIEERDSEPVPVIVPEEVEYDNENTTTEAQPQPVVESIVGKDAFILTDGGSINLRSEANTESAILDVLSVGTQLKILEDHQEWLHIETGEHTGYVKAEFVSFDYEQVKTVLLSSVMYQKATVNLSSNIRGTADENSIILDMVGEGSTVIILETTDNGWHKVYFGDNYDIGYISAANVTIGDMVRRSDVNSKRAARIFSVAKNAKITTSESVVEVKLLPNAESETLTTLANNTSCKIISGGSNWTKIIVSATNEIGYVRTSEVKEIVVEKKPVATPAPTSTPAPTPTSTPAPAQTPAATQTPAQTAEKPQEAKPTPTPKAKTETKTETPAQPAPSGSGNGAKLVAEAAKYLGTKYVYGGSSPSGFDCSGLVQYSLRKLGVSIARSSRAQYAYGTPVAKANLQPGDLVFFSRGGSISHVAIYAGNGQVIHAPRTGKTVCYQSLSGLTRSLNYVGARRVL